MIKLQTIQVTTCGRPIRVFLWAMSIFREKVNGGQYMMPISHCIFFLHLIKYQNLIMTHETELLNFNEYLLNKCRQKYLKIKTRALSLFS